MVPMAIRSIESNSLITCLVSAESGRIAIMIYYGHEGGMEEKDAVIKWTSSLPQKDWEVTSYAPLNQIHTPPILVLIEKRVK